MKVLKSSLLGCLLLMLPLFMSVQAAFAAGELAVMFEDAEEFNSRTNLGLNLGKFHDVATPPTDFLLFFNLFCEGNAGSIGGTEAILEETGRAFNENGGGELFNDMIICEFCQCAGLEGQEFEDCHAANESCITVNNARFVFDPIVTPNLLPDPQFPDAVLFMFTMTEHDPPTDCTGRFKEFCDQGALKLTHHCTHLIDAMGNILKSVGSAYIISVQ